MLDSNTSQGRISLRAINILLCLFMILLFSSCLGTEVAEEENLGDSFAAERSAVNQNNFHMACAGDTQFKENHPNFYWNEMHSDSIAALRNHVGSSNFAGVLFLGDLTHDGKQVERNQWDIEYTSRFDIKPLLGNHDYYSLGGFGQNAYNNIGWFGNLVDGIPHNTFDYEESYGYYDYRRGSLAWDFDIGDKRFIMLSGYPSKTWYMQSYTQIVDIKKAYNWLRARLDASSGKKVFILMHEFLRVNNTSEFKNIVKDYDNIAGYFGGHYGGGTPWRHLINRDLYNDGVKNRYYIQCGGVDGYNASNLNRMVHVNFRETYFKLRGMKTNTGVVNYSGCNVGNCWMVDNFYASYTP